jgi:bifunctional non-homologous end joining protein LigD
VAYERQLEASPGWRDHLAVRPAAALLPVVEPVVPVRYSAPFDDRAWALEPKFDGLRGLLYLSGRECHSLEARERPQSIRGSVLLGREELKTRDVILDGEIVALDEHGRQDCRLQMAGLGNRHYAAFDVLWLKGKDLRGCSLARRRRVLERLIPNTSTMLLRVFTVRGRGHDLFQAVERLDLEGIVAKRLRDPYDPGTEWRKIRNGAFTQMVGRRELFHR